MAAVPSLTFATWTDDAIQAFGPVCQVNPWGSIESLGELLHGAHLVAYSHNDQEALIALRREQYGAGVRVHLQAMVSTGAAPLQARQLMDSVEALAVAWHGDVLTMVSQHPKIAATAKRWGGHISGAVICKHLRTH